MKNIRNRKIGNNIVKADYEVSLSLCKYIYLIVVIIFKSKFLIDEI